MYDERKVHVKPWKHRGHRERPGRTRIRLGWDWPTVLGLACLVLTLAWVTCMVLPFYSIFMGLFCVSLEFSTWAPRWAMGVWITFFWLLGIGAFMLLIGLHFGGGLLLILRDGAGGRILRIFAKAVLVVQGVFLLSAVCLQGVQVRDAWGGHFPWWVYADLAAWAVWPAFVLIWLNRPKVRAEMARWANAGGPAAP